MADVNLAGGDAGSGSGFEGSLVLTEGLVARSVPGGRDLRREELHERATERGGS